MEHNKYISTSQLEVVRIIISILIHENSVTATEILEFLIDYSLSMIMGKNNEKYLHF